MVYSASHAPASNFADEIVKIVSAPPVMVIGTSIAGRFLLEFVVTNTLYKLSIRALSAAVFV